MHRTLVLVVSVFLLASSSALAAGSDRANKGVQLFGQKKYKEAAVIFREVVQKSPDDSSYQYYLALSSLYSGDAATARGALGRILLTTASSNEYNKRAAALMSQYRWPRPLFVGSKSLCRWSSEAMPLKVCVTRGLQLPDQYSNRMLTAGQLAELSAALKRPQFDRQLKVASNFNSSCPGLVNKGMATWGWAVSERLVSYIPVSDMTTADIVIFWRDGSRVRGITSKSTSKRQPAIIELFLPPLSADGNKADFETLLTGVSGHEFGHALGMVHTPVKDGFMHASGSCYLDPGSNSFKIHPLSPEERATFRALYQTKPKVSYDSVKGG